MHGLNLNFKQKCNILYFGLTLTLQFLTISCVKTNKLSSNPEIEQITEAQNLYLLGENAYPSWTIGPNYHNSSSVVPDHSKY